MLAVCPGRAALRFVLTNATGRVDRFSLGDQFHVIKIK